MIKQWIAKFAATGKGWVGLWSFAFLVLSVYSVVCQKPIGEGPIVLFTAILGAYTTNRTINDYNVTKEKQ